MCSRTVDSDRWPFPSCPETAEFEPFLDAHFPREKFPEFRQAVDSPDLMRMAAPKQGVEISPASKLANYRFIIETRRYWLVAARIDAMIAAMGGGKKRRPPLLRICEWCDSLFIAWRNNTRTCQEKCGAAVRQARKRARAKGELAKLALVKLQSKILEEERTGVIEASAKTKIGDLLPLMELDFLREGKKTWDDVLCRWNLHLKAHYADLRAGELTSADNDRYIILRQREKASNGTINRELAVVERMLHLDERTTTPLVRGVPYFKKLKKADPRSDFLEQIDYERLRQHASELWLRALLATYYTHGFRRSELLRLRVRQVNLIDGTINLPAGATKNGRPRMVVMTSEVRALMTASIQGKGNDDHVFTRDDGAPVRAFRDAWKKMFAAAGVEERKLHDMRRSAVRNAIRRGVDRDTVKKMSGHLTDDVFSRYNFQSTDDLRDAARKIEDGAASVKTQTDTKTDILEKAPSESGQMLQ